MHIRSVSRRLVRPRLNIWQSVSISPRAICIEAQLRERRRLEPQDRSNQRAPAQTTQRPSSLHFPRRSIPIQPDSRERQEKRVLSMRHADPNCQSQRHVVMFLNSRPFQNATNKNKTTNHNKYQQVLDATRTHAFRVYLSEALVYI